MPWTGVLGWLASSSHSCFDCPIIMHDPLCHMTILQKSIIWTPYSYLIERTVNFWAGKDETAGNGFFFSIVGILAVNGKAWSAVAKKQRKWSQDLWLQGSKNYDNHCHWWMVGNIGTTIRIYGNGSENGNALKLLWFIGGKQMHDGSSGWLWWLVMVENDGGQQQNSTMVENNKRK